MPRPGDDDPDDVSRLGRALANEQIDEYQEAHQAQREGKDLARLRICANIATALLLCAAVAIVVWAITHSSR